MARADDADNLVLTLHYDKFFDNLIYNAITAAVARIRTSRGLSSSQAESIAVEIRSHSTVAKSEFLEAVAARFRARYSTNEITQLRDFYSSDLGQKTASIQPTIQEDVASIARSTALTIGALAARLSAPASP